MRSPLDPMRIEVVDDPIAEVLRRNGKAASVEMIASAWRFMRRTLWAQIISRHPDWNETAVNAEVNRRLAGGST